MTNKKPTKKQQKAMLYDAVMIAEGAQEPTPEMSYVQAWQYLVDTGACWTLQGWFGRAAMRMISDGTLTPPPIKEEPDNNGDKQ